MGKDKKGGLLGLLTSHSLLEVGQMVQRNPELLVNAAADELRTLADYGIGQAADVLQRRLQGPPEEAMPPPGGGVPQSAAAGSRRDPYEILGVHPNASMEQIEANYRWHAKELHNRGDFDPKMTDLNWAIEEVRRQRKRGTR